MSNHDHDPVVESRHGGIQVIARAAAIMRALAGHPHGLSLGALAQKVSLPRSTVQRIVGALETEKLVESVGPGGGFRLGLELGRLIYQTQIDIVSAVRPLLEDLSSTLRESVALCAADKERLYVIDRVIAERELRVVFPMGVVRLPLHTTAPGKALLAAMSDEQVQRLLPHVLPQGTPKSRDRAALLEELEAVRASGFARDMEEHMEGVVAFAAAVDTYFGHFAISVVVPTARAGRPEDFKRALLACKRAVEERIGGQGAP